MTHPVPGFVGIFPLPLRRVRRGDCRPRGAATTANPPVPVAVVTASIGRPSACAGSLLMAAALGILSVTPASAAMLDDGQAIKNCAAYVA